MGGQRLSPRRGGLILRHGLLVLMVVLAVGPLAGVVIVSLHAPGSSIGGSAFFGDLGFKSYNLIVLRSGFAADLGSSAFIALLVGVLTTLVSLPAGFALAKVPFLGRRGVLALVLLGLVVPGPTILVPLYYEFRRLGLDGTSWSVILPEAAGSAAFGLFWMRAVFRGVPSEMVEAASVDGASLWTTFLRICLPLARSGGVVLFLLSFLWSWNAFMLPLVMLAGSPLQTGPLGLAGFQGAHTTDIPAQAAAAVLLFLPMILLYAGNQRRFVQGLTDGAVRS